MARFVWVCAVVERNCCSNESLGKEESGGFKGSDVRSLRAKLVSFELVAPISEGQAAPLPLSSL